MSKDPKFPPMPARLDPFGTEKPKTEIVGVFANKRDAGLHVYGYSEAHRLFVRDTGVEPSWLAGFEAGCIWGAAIVAWAEAIRQRCQCPPDVIDDEGFTVPIPWSEVCERCKGYP
jgi:hypothetical protein